MSLLKFELKKVLAQRKYIWLVAIVLLVTSAILWQNLSHQEGMVDRALAEVEPLVNEVATLQRPLQDLLDNQGLNELQQHQYNSLQQMRMGLTRWRNAINQKQWSEVPLLQEAFLGNLQVYAGHQGMFSALDGADREVAMAKNSWMLEHNLPYEDELYPVSPSLMLKQTGGIFLGLLGIIVLLLFFGNSMTEEKEQYTVLTLKTQPLSRFQVLLAKYISLLMVMLLFIILVVAIGLVIPWQFGSGSLSFDYPQVLTSGEAFTIISTGEYLVRAIVLFFSAGSISFGISLLVSTWAKKSFTAYLLMAAVIGTGYFATAGIQSPFNPFYLLNFSQILASFAPGGEWRYLLSAGLWSAVLLMLTAVLSEQEISIGPGDNTKQPFAKGDTGGLPLMLARIWTFEWRKLLREGLLRQLAIFLLLFLVAGFLALNHQAQLRQQTYLEDLEQYSVYLAGNMEWMQQEVDMYQAEAEILAEVGIENYDSPLRRHLVYDSFEFQITQFQSAIDYLVELQAAISAALIGYQTGDWAAFHQYQLLDNRFHNREFSTGSWSTNLAEHVGRFTVAVSIEEKKLLMEHNIQPVFSGEFIVTIYPSWTGDLYERWGLEWEEENKKVDSSGLFSLYHALENYVYFLPMVLLLFLLGGGLRWKRVSAPRYGC